MRKIHVLFVAQNSFFKVYMWRRGSCTANYYRFQYIPEPETTKVILETCFHADAVTIIIAQRGSEQHIP